MLFENQNNSSKNREVVRIEEFSRENTHEYRRPYTYYTRRKKNVHGKSIRKLYSTNRNRAFFKI